MTNDVTKQTEEAEKKKQPSDRATTKEEQSFYEEEQSSSEMDFGAILEQFEQEQTAFSKGELVSGKVVGISERGVLIDFGYMSEGVADISEFTSPEGEVTVKQGDEVEVTIRSMDSPPILSRMDALRRRAWNEIETAYNQGTPITGCIIDKTKGGLRVDINGVEAFLPGSQVDSRPIRNLDSFKGQEIEAKVIKFSRKRNNIVLSRKVLIDELVNKQKAETLNSVEEGSVVEGTVKSLLEYGAFVDIGGIDGLLHVTDMSWGRLDRPSEMFKVGDRVRVKILKLDREKEKVSFGYKQLITKKTDGWKTEELENCLSAIIDYRGKTPTKTSSGIPLITAKIVKNGRIETPNEFIAEEDYKSWMTRGYPKIGDVILTTEAPLGEVAQINDERIALAQRIILLRGKENYLDNTYLKYFLISDFGQSELSSRQSGTTVFGIKQSELRKIKVTFPTFEEQKAIAKFLSSLDDKMELNRQMNATLESIVRVMFKAWFVDFEPVLANMENRPSESASPEIAKLFPTEFENGIPNGWRTGTLSEIAFNHRQNINPSEVNAETAYVGLEHIPRKSIALTDWGKSDKAESIKSDFKVNDILFGKLRPYFQKVVIAPIDGICSTDILVIRAKEPYHFGQTLIYCSSDEIIQYADRLSNGAKMPRTSWWDLAKFEIVIPSKQISEEFSKYVTSITEKIKLNISENKELEQIRNSLLPRIISGKLPIEKN